MPRHIVFTAVPGHGHLYPMVPLARTLSVRGHRVTFVTGAQLQERVRELGFTCLAAGPTLEEMQRRALDDVRTRAFLADAPWKVAAAIFAGRARDMLADLDGLDLEPDLVVHDAYELAGPVLAARASVPWVTHGLGPRWPSYLEERVGMLLAGSWAQVAGPPPPRAGIGRHAYVEICPPVARADDSFCDDPVFECRPEPLDEPPHAAAAAPVSGRRRIYATLGTFTNADPAPFRMLLAVLGAADADVVMTVGDRVDRLDLGPIPSNVQLETYVPQAQILAGCDLVVCHGGSGSVLAALSRSVPLVIVPQGADQFRNAPFWARSGAAVVVGTGDLSPAAIDAALAGSVAGGPLRTAAETAARSIASMPAVEELALHIEALVG